MIESVRGKDFLSWEQLDYTIPEGVALIEGFNYDDDTPEGCGKSAILNAICWGIYGRLPKEAKVDDVIRHGAKSCSVEVQLSGDARTFRSRKPNSLYLEVDGEKIRGKDARETQAKIEEYIGMSFETFCQTVYFAQNYPNKFITANEQDRARVFSEIVDLSVFDEARARAHQKVKLVEIDWAKLKTELEYLPAMITQHEDSITSLKELREDCETEHGHLKKGFEGDIAECVEDLEALEKEKVKYSKDGKGARKAVKVLKDDEEELKENDVTLREQIAVIQSSTNTIARLLRNVEREKECKKEFQNKLTEIFHIFI